MSVHPFYLPLPSKGFKKCLSGTANFYWVFAAHDDSCGSALGVCLFGQHLSHVGKYLVDIVILFQAINKFIDEFFLLFSQFRKGGREALEIC